MQPNSELNQKMAFNRYNAEFRLCILVWFEFVLLYSLFFFFPSFFFLFPCVTKCNQILTQIKIYFESNSEFHLLHVISLLFDLSFLLPSFPFLVPSLLFPFIFDCPFCSKFLCLFLSWSSRCSNLAILYYISYSSIGVQVLSPIAVCWRLNHEPAPGAPSESDSCPTTGSTGGFFQWFNEGSGNKMRWNTREKPWERIHKRLDFALHVRDSFCWLWVRIEVCKPIVPGTTRFGEHPKSLEADAISGTHDTNYYWTTCWCRFVAGCNIKPRPPIRGSSGPREIANLRDIMANSWPLATSNHNFCKILVCVYMYILSSYDTSYIVIHRLAAIQCEDHHQVQNRLMI